MNEGPHCGLCVMPRGRGAVPRVKLPGLGAKCRAMGAKTQQAGHRGAGTGTALTSQASKASSNSATWARGRHASDAPASIQVLRDVRDEESLPAVVDRSIRSVPRDI